jgi:hypothetical protein
VPKSFERYLKVESFFPERLMLAWMLRKVAQMWTRSHGIIATDRWDSWQVTACSGVKSRNSPQTGHSEPKVTIVTV